MEPILDEQTANYKISEGWLMIKCYKPRLGACIWWHMQPITGQAAQHFGSKWASGSLEGQQEKSNDIDIV